PMLQLVTTNIVLFHTSGVASWSPPPSPTSADHTRPRRLTFDASIILSGLKRVSPGVRPYVSQSPSDADFAAFLSVVSSTRLACPKKVPNEVKNRTIAKR